MRVIGEEHLFGIDEGQLEPFLTRRGFHDVRNTTSEDLRRLYFTGHNARRKVATGAAIASARVNKAGATLDQDGLPSSQAEAGQSKGRGVGSHSRESTPPVQTAVRRLG